MRSTQLRRRVRVRVSSVDQLVVWLPQIRYLKGSLDLGARKAAWYDEVDLLWGIIFPMRAVSRLGY